MKYYMIQGGSGSTRYCELRIPQDSVWFQEEFLQANEWNNRNLPLPIPMNANNKYKPDDFPMADSTLVSKKVLDCIKAVNKSYEALPTQIYYKGEKIYDLYYTMLFPEYPLLNYEESDYETTRKNPKNIWMLRNLILEKKKIEMLPKDNSIFCVQELTTRIICTEIAKDALEKAGVIGMKFEELEIR